MKCEKNNLHLIIHLKEMQIHMKQIRVENILITTPSTPQLYYTTLIIKMKNKCVQTVLETLFFQICNSYLTIFSLFPKIYVNHFVL